MQLVNHSLIRPIDLVRDMLVRLNDPIFPFDFYVLKMDVNFASSASSLSML